MKIGLESESIALNLGPGLDGAANGLPEKGGFSSHGFPHRSRHGADQGWVRAILAMGHCPLASSPELP